MSETNSLWNECEASLNANDLPELPSMHTLRKLQQGGHSQLMALYALTALDNHMQKNVINTLVLAVPPASSQQLISAVNKAHTHFQASKNAITTLEDLLSECKGVTRSFLLRAASIRLKSIPETFTIGVYQTLRSQQHQASQLCRQLVDLGLAPIVEQAVSTLLFADIDSLVTKQTKNSLKQRSLPDLLKWIDHAVQTWLRDLLPPPSEVVESSQWTTSHDNTQFNQMIEQRKHKQMEQWKKRLSFHLHESVCNIRTSQLLQMIHSFPDTLPAVEDLKDCILSTDQKPFVTSSLRQQFVDNILNAGVATADILQQYLNMIRMLKYLDHTGVILENVSGPIRAYLRRRPDTVRCIVSGMTGNGDLYEELQRAQANKSTDRDGDVNMMTKNSAADTDHKVKDHEDEDCLSIDGDFNANMEVNAADYDSWEPEPIDAPSKDSKWKSGGDAIATLVAIFGSSEQIVNEYKGVLADKLIGSFELDIDRQSRILNLLTERFGSKAMHTCSIMLKDIKNSERPLQLSRTVAEKEGCPTEMDDFEVTVVSKVFWPTLGEEPEFKYPPRLEKQMKRFEDSYKAITRPRVLEWQHGLGAVSVKLTFDDGREIEANLSPMQATILSHFQENNRLNVKDLQQDMNVKDESLFRRKLQGLVNQGILRATDGSNTVYETVEHSKDIDINGGTIDDGEGDENGEGDVDATVSHENKQMAVYESYIMAMLQNLKQLPLEQIHSMLKRFVQTPVYDRTTAQLAAFLGKLVDEGKVEVRGGIYKVKPKT